MLASPFNPRLVRFPCFVQPKLDGFRAVFVNGRLYSRNGHPWADSLFPDILDALRRSVPAGAILDGELYRHGWHLYRIAEAISLQRQQPSADTHEIGFYIFDLFAPDPFADRHRQVCDTVSRISSGRVQCVPTYPIANADEGDAWHALHRTAGMEGTMYRIGNARYVTSRTTALMKRKHRPGSSVDWEKKKPADSRWPNLVRTI